MSTLSAAIKRWAARRGLVATRVANECRRYLRKFDNRDNDRATNGEHWLMERVANAEVVFDAGANNGDWSLACATRCPKATIHAFEILPPTFFPNSRRT
jgi:hypothetical protein